MRVLLVEDDVDLAENIVDFFDINNFATDYTPSGENALELLHDNPYDIVILDVGLPKLNGFDVCSFLRYKLRLNTPVLMLTARTMLEDKIKGFETGADDYLTKPFELAELKMRVCALVRRSKQAVAELFCIDDLCVNIENGIVMRGGVRIELPPICFAILAKLVEQYPGYVTKEEIEYAIWKDEPPITDSLKVHFHTLRQLLDKPFKKQLIHSIRGRGYFISEKEVIVEM